MSENVEMRNAVCTLSHGVLRKLPPSASSGAKATACTAPSTRPHFWRSDSVSAVKCAGLRHVQLQHLGAGLEPLGAPLGERAGPAKAREEDLRALSQRMLGDAEGQGLRGQHTGDQDLLALQQHGEPFARKKREAGRFTTPDSRWGVKHETPQCGNAHPPAYQGVPRR